MTMPWMMNCAHSPEGWCLECVVKLGNRVAELERDNLYIKKTMIDMQNYSVKREAAARVEGLRRAIKLVEDEEATSVQRWGGSYVSTDVIIGDFKAEIAALERGKGE